MIHIKSCLQIPFEMDFNLSEVLCVSFFFVSVSIPFWAGGFKKMTEESESDETLDPNRVGDPFPLPVATSL